MFPTAFQTNGGIGNLSAIGNTLYAQTFLGIYTSINQGQSWQLINNSNLRFPSGIPTPRLSVVDSTVFVGQFGGVYRLNSVPSSVRIAEEHAMRIFPQPADGSATLEYSLSEASLVQVEIVNSLGASVVKYDAKQQGSGLQRMTLATEALAQGAYFVRVNIGGKVATVLLQVVR
jgi:hypothetical protein